MQVDIRHPRGYTSEEMGWSCMKLRGGDLTFYSIFIIILSSLDKADDLKLSAEVITQNDGRHQHFDGRKWLWHPRYGGVHR